MQSSGGKHLFSSVEAQSYERKEARLSPRVQNTFSVPQPSVSTPLQKVLLSTETRPSKDESAKGFKNKKSCEDSSSPKSQPKSKKDDGRIRNTTSELVAALMGVENSYGKHIRIKDTREEGGSSMSGAATAELTDENNNINTEAMSRLPSSSADGGGAVRYLASPQPPSRGQQLPQRQLRHEFIDASVDMGTPNAIKQFYTEMSFLLHHTVASIAHTVGATKCVLLAPSSSANSNLAAFNTQRLMEMHVRQPPPAQSRTACTTSGTEVIADASPNNESLDHNSEGATNSMNEAMVGGGATDTTKSQQTNQTGATNRGQGGEDALVSGTPLPDRQPRPEDGKDETTFSPLTMASRPAQGAAAVVSPRSMEATSECHSPRQNTSDGQQMHVAITRPQRGDNGCDLYAVAAWSACGNTAAENSRSKGSSGPSLSGTKFLPHDFVAKGEGQSTASMAMRLNLVLNCGAHMEPSGGGVVGSSGPSYQSPADQPPYPSYSVGPLSQRPLSSSSMASLSSAADAMNTTELDGMLLPSTRRSLHYSALYVPIELDPRRYWGAGAGALGSGVSTRDRDDVNDERKAQASSVASLGGVVRAANSVPSCPVAVLVLLNKRDESVSTWVDAEQQSSSGSPLQSDEDQIAFTNFTVQDESLALSCARGALGPLFLRCWNFGRRFGLSADGPWGKKTSPHGSFRLGTPQRLHEANISLSDPSLWCYPNQNSPSHFAASLPPSRVRHEGHTGTAAIIMSIDFARLRAAFEDVYQPRLLGTSNRSRFFVDHCARGGGGGLLATPCDKPAIAALSSTCPPGVVPRTPSKSKSKTTQGKTSPNDAARSSGVGAEVGATVSKARPQFYKSFKEALLVRVGMLPPIEVAGIYDEPRNSSRPHFVYSSSLTTALGAGNEVPDSNLSVVRRVADNHATRAPQVPPEAKTIVKSSFPLVSPISVTASSSPLPLSPRGLQSKKSESRATGNRPSPPCSPKPKPEASAQSKGKPVNATNATADTSYDIPSLMSSLGNTAGLARVGSGSLHAVRGSSAKRPQLDRVGGLRILSPKAKVLAINSMVPFPPSSLPHQHNNDVTISKMSPQAPLHLPRGRIPLSLEAGGAYDPYLAQQYVLAQIYQRSAHAQEGQGGGVHAGGGMPVSAEVDSVDEREEGAATVAAERRQGSSSALTNNGSFSRDLSTYSKGAGSFMGKLSGGNVYHGRENRNVVRFSVYNTIPNGMGGVISSSESREQSEGPSPRSSFIAVLDDVGPHTPIVPLLDYVSRLEHVADAVTAALYSDNLTESSKQERYLKGAMIRAARAEEQNVRLLERNETLLRENVAREREIQQLRAELSTLQSTMAAWLEKSNQTTMGGTTYDDGPLAGAAGYESNGTLSDVTPRKSIGGWATNNKLAPRPSFASSTLSSPQKHGVRSSYRASVSHSEASRGDNSESALQHNQAVSPNSSPKTDGTNVNELTNQRVRGPPCPPPVGSFANSRLNYQLDSIMSHGQNQGTRRSANSSRLPHSSVCLAPIPMLKGGGEFQSVSPTLRPEPSEGFEVGAGRTATISFAEQVPKRALQEEERAEWGNEAEGAGERVGGANSHIDAMEGEGRGGSIADEANPVTSVSGRESLGEKSDGGDVAALSPTERHRTHISRWFDTYERKRMQLLDEIGL